MHLRDAGPNPDFADDAFNRAREALINDVVMYAGGDAVRMGDLRDGVDVGDVGIRVAARFAEDELGGVSEGCTHHRQCEDIGTVKFPRWIRDHTGRDIDFSFTSGTEFPDDLSNSSEVAIDRIRDIVAADEQTGTAPAGASARLHFIRATLLDAQAMRSVFERFPIDAVIHFAGFKAVGESVSKPLEYYGNNLGGTMELLRAMNEAGCRSIVFSSSATDLRRETTLALEQLSIPHPYSYHSNAPSQNAIELRYAEAVTCADNIIIMKKGVVVRKQCIALEHHGGIALVWSKLINLLIAKEDLSLIRALKTQGL